MPSQTFTQCKGLLTGPNSESAGPGTLKQAVNVVIKRPDLIEKRRPLRELQPLFGLQGSAWGAGMFGFNGRLVVVNTSGEVYQDDGTNKGVFTDLGRATYSPNSGLTGVSPPIGQFVTAELAGSVYATLALNSSGIAPGLVYKMDALSVVPYKAGVPKCPDIQCTAAANSAGFLSANSVVGYRVLFYFVDANGLLVVGQPSGRVSFTNAAATGNVTVKTILPFDILKAPVGQQTKFGYQVYRTSVVANGQDPGDEMGLVYQTTLTATDITNKYVQVIDVYSDSLNKGAALYTNASQGGVVQANSQPPTCRDLAAFKGAMFYANTQGKYRLNATLLGIPDQYAIQSIAANTPIAGKSTYTFLAGVIDPQLSQFGVLSVTGSTGGSNDGSWPISSITATTIVVSNAGVAQAAAGGSAMSAYLVAGNVTYNAAYVESPLNGYFQVTTTGTTSQQIAQTATSICRVIAYQQTTTSAFYAAGPDDPPGGIQFEDVGSPVNGQWSVQADSGNNTTFSQKWAPALNVSRAAASDAAINRVFFSKYGQPEHVPLVNYFDIGGKTKAIVRVVALRDSLFVLKEDGVFRITGDGTNWSVARFDDTIQVLGVQSNYSGQPITGSIAVAYNTIYAVTPKGVVSITDNGLRLISEPISGMLRYYTESASNPLCTLSSVSERDGCVYFYLKTGTANASQSMAICYNLKTTTWTQMDTVASQAAASYGVTVGGYAYRMTADSALTGLGTLMEEVSIEPGYEDAAVLALELLAGSPIPGDRARATISSVNSAANQITIANASLAATWNHTVAVGDLVHENPAGTNPYSGQGGLWKITSVSGTAPATLTLTPFLTSNGGGFPFTAAATSVVIPVQSTIEYNPFTAGDDDVDKRFVESNLLMHEASTAIGIVMGSYTGIQKNELDQTQTGPVITSVRQLIPLTNQRARRLSVVWKHSSPGQFFLVKGINYNFQIYPDSRVVE